MRVMVDMSATLLHYGHVRLLKRAKEMGHVVVGMTSDQEVYSKKGYHPEIAFDQRKELLQAIEFVDEVVETPWLIDEAVLDKHKIDLLLHGEDNSNPINAERLKVVERTPNISSQDLRKRALESLVSQANRKKLLTPGPGRLLAENLTGLMPCFGRGDVEYDALETAVLDKLKSMSDHHKIARMQGSASTALEVAMANFVFGKCLVIDSGYYAKRLVSFARHGLQEKRIAQLDVVTPNELDQVSGSYDWVVGVYTETAIALKTDLARMRRLSDQLGAQLLLDATGSIGLEDGHEMSDVVCYSSCKGLLGLTGAGFVAFNTDPQNEISSFTLSLDTHLSKKCTGPYHAMASLVHVVENQPQVRQSVAEAKQNFITRFEDRLVRAPSEQPNLCTLVNGIIKPQTSDIVLYQPRDQVPGTSVLCHIGEASTTGKAVDDIHQHFDID